MQDAGKSKRRRRYADDIRQSVLTKMASGEVSLREVSAEFGISVPTLIKWRKEELAEASEPVSVDFKHQNTARSENQLLREEIERLKEERNRLRRSIAMLVGSKITD